MVEGDTVISVFPDDAGGFAPGPEVKVDLLPEGTETLAHLVVKTIEDTPNNFTYLYPDAMPLKQKIETIAREIYRADAVTLGAAIGHVHINAADVDAAVSRPARRVRRW